MPANPQLALEGVRPGSVAAWKIALRPQSFPIAVIPVVVGTAVAWAEFGTFHAGVALLSLAGSVVAQAITNLQNDVGYTLRGGETGTRTGLPRATATGLLTVAAVRRSIALAVAAAALIAAPLVAYRGWPVVPITVASIAAAYAYMGGPRPIAYTPFGELTVLLFFGLTAVCGTVYVQSGSVGAVAWIAGVAIGMLAAAVLAVGNYRDAAHDATTGRRTFPVVAGMALSRRLVATLIFVPFVLAAAMAATAQTPTYLLAVLALPRACRIWRSFVSTPPGHGLTPVLFGTVMLEALFGALLAVGAALARAGG
jgi:1,4-dihydroxy-2-naphthoate octaprenyltransferase